jgi:hypothetical protein
VVSGSGLGCSGFGGRQLEGLIVADLEVDLDVLAELSARLSTVRAELDGVHPMLDAGMVASGSGRVAPGIASFGHGWVDGRRTIESEIDALSSAITQVAQGFLAAEEQLAAAAPKPSPSSGKSGR